MGRFQDFIQRADKVGASPLFQSLSLKRSNFAISVQHSVTQLHTHQAIRGIKEYLKDKVEEKAGSGLGHQGCDPPNTKPGKESQEIHHPRSEGSCKADI